MIDKRLAVILCIFSLTACDWLGDKLPENWSQSNTDSSSRVVPSPRNYGAPQNTQPPLVDWKGNGIAANTFIEISKRADLGVVNIGTTKTIKQENPFGYPNSPFNQFFGDDLFKHFFGGPRGNAPREFKQQSLGSGFIISEDGLIVTNNHVIDKADEIQVTIGKDKEYIAKVVGTDPKTDVALIKVDPNEPLKPLVLGDSQTLQVGEIVVAIGNPFGLSHTVTQGIVSAKERTIGFGPYDNFIQTDASINPGNSGGPLLNLNAEVVGINTAIHASGQGIGFAIPINLAKNILPQLEENGQVTRGWLGVYIQPVEDDVAKSLGLDKAKGALVVRVEQGSPADQAGIEAGDVILAVGDQPVKDSQSLPKMVANLGVGTQTQVVVLRDRKERIVTVTIGKLQDENAGPKTSPDAPDAEPDKIGLLVSPATQQELESFGVPQTQGGVVIRSIEPGSPAFGRGIKPGDYLLELNKKRIATVEDYQAQVKGLSDGDTVMLKVIQEGGARLFVIFTI